MLIEVNVIYEQDFLYRKVFGKSIDKIVLEDLLSDIWNDAFKAQNNQVDIYDYFKYKLTFIADKKSSILFLLITGLTDSHDKLKSEILKFKNNFLQDFSDVIATAPNSFPISLLDPMVEALHRNLKPKISLVGFSGVGKTTITRLIKAEEIPTHHIPTISGEVSSIKIGKLAFNLWDFAGQEQFSFLWNKFIKGSDAVLLISDSSLANVEKSKFFLDLIKEEAPYAHVAIIGNKQDLPDSIEVTRIEEMLGIKSYAMIATDPGNRNKMIQIIADILEMDAEVSPLLKPLLDRDKFVEDAQKALKMGDFEAAAQYFEQIAELCTDIGDYALGVEFYQKYEQLKSIIKTTS